MQLPDVTLLFGAARAVELFKQRRQQSFWQARCAASCARNHSSVRARREPLDDQVDLCHGVYRIPPPRSEVLTLRIINIKIYNIGLKSNTYCLNKSNRAQP